MCLFLQDTSDFFRKEGADYGYYNLSEKAEEEGLRETVLSNRVVYNKAQMACNVVKVSIKKLSPVNTKLKSTLKTGAFSVRFRQRPCYGAGSGHGKVIRFFFKKKVVPLFNFIYNRMYRRLLENEEREGDGEVFFFQITSISSKFKR